MLECICIILLIILIYNSCIKENFINISYGEKQFKVLKNKSDSDTAANILKQIDKNILELIKHLNKKYSNLEYNYNELYQKKKLLKNIIHRLNTSYNSNSLRENYPSIPGKDVSYNINKGSKISVCLRDYENPDTFHSFNDIMFVSLHEIAHSCNETYGHDIKFWKIFRILLENASEIDIFKNINYTHNKVNYCSMNITYNPIFDKTLDDDIYFNLI